MSKIEVNAIEPQCGTTLTIGASDTSIAGIGTVNWDTTAKTAAFTAVSGRGYFVNTTSAAITVTLPASPSAGDIVFIKDYAATFDANNCTLARNGSNIEGAATNIALSTESQSIGYIYVDSTKGWVAVSDMTTPQIAKYVTATGGTVTTSGDFKIHTFTGPGTFCVSDGGNSLGSNTVDYFVVAGGGGASGDIGGGGGAGGFRLSNSTCMPSPQTSPLANSSGLPVATQGYPITIGAGGSGSPSGNGPTTASNPGTNSVFSTITSAGGGGSRSYGGDGPGPDDGGGLPGGSGGAAKRGTGHTGGSGNTPPVSPPQGNDGGSTPAPPSSGSLTRSAGGGGAGAAGGVGQDPSPSSGGGGAGSFVVSSGFAGCNGTTGPITGARYFSGGGAGGGNAAAGSAPTSGTVGGGGTSNSGDCGPAGASGTTNTGGGGSGGGNDGAGGAGGSGIVIIRYKFQ